jgi:hypothetical protein
MGCGMSTEEKEGKARNEEIENQLKRDRMQQRNEIKMLLLGMSSARRRDLHSPTIVMRFNVSFPASGSLLTWALSRRCW